MSIFRMKINMDFFFGETRHHTETSLKEKSLFFDKKVEFENLVLETNKYIFILYLANTRERP